MMNRFVLKFVLCLLLGAIAGCNATSRSVRKDEINNSAAVADSSRLRELKIGASVAELKGNEHVAFVLPLRHHLTIVSGQECIQVLTGWPSPGMPFVFFFENHRLTRIIDPTVQMLNALLACENPTQIVQDLRSDESLTDQGFQEAIMKRDEDWHTHMKFAEPLPVLPFCILSVAGTSHDQYIQLMHRFDGTEVRLGQTIEQIDRRYGSPASIVQLDD